MDDYSSLLRDAMSSVGLVCPADLHITGGVVRFSSGEDRDKASWYALHHDPSGVIYGGFGCFRRGITQGFCSKSQNDMPKEQWIAVQRSIAEAKKKANEERDRLQAEAAKAAAEVVAESMPIEGHSYLERKQVKAYGNIITMPDGRMGLPLVDIDGNVKNIQAINDDGEKRFQPEAKVKGCFFEVASPEKFNGPITIVEGYATGATCHEATGWPTVCAMFRGNLLDVGLAMRKKYPNRPIVFAADNDQFTQGNPGLTDAKAAAAKINAVCTHPIFPEVLLPKKPTDFNDVLTLGGTYDDIKTRLCNAFPVKVVSIGDLQLPPPNDPSELIRNRFLCRGGATLFTGPTGVGKSSLLMQVLALWALGEPCFGLTPTKALRSIIIQAENDDGDLAYMRDGVCRGLEFSEARRGLFFHRVKVHTSNGMVGDKFFKEVLEPLLAVHECDLIVLDPVLAYIGGDVKEQEVVSPFLREFLQPLLKKYDIAAILAHHTNKPKEKKGDAMFGELAYSGSGSAEFANWARGVLALQATANAGVFSLHAGKRGSRIGWRDEDNQISYQRLIRWSRDSEVICWSEATADDAADQTPNQVLSCLPDGGLKEDEWFDAVEERFPKIKRAAFNATVKVLKRDERATHSKVFDKWQPILTNR